MIGSLGLIAITLIFWNSSGMNLGIERLKLPLTQLSGLGAL